MQYSFQFECSELSDSESTAYLKISMDDYIETAL